MHLYSVFDIRLNSCLVKSAINRFSVNINETPDLEHEKSSFIITPRNKLELQLRGFVELLLVRATVSGNNLG